jgi:hypothetical protein
MNIVEYIPQLHVTKEYTGDHTPHAPAMCLYIPQLTEEYRATCSSAN